MTLTVNRIKQSAASIHNKITKRQKPSMHVPIRALSNVKYTPKRGFFELRGQRRSVL